ncbi:aldehyde dehydrogenase family protein [Humibacter albus]|uniref:aldehyde dehydrogenase family protein n=1 Tax=Humibacter albus TaxID=427754 RepID=UPI0003B33FA7|nr:aldehyde dehydrogenase family protein [Humibacter albus]
MTSEEIADNVVQRRRAFESGITKPLAWRREQLNGIRRMLTERAAEWEAALAADLHRSPTEANLADVNVVLSEVAHALKNLRTWTSPRRVSLPLSVQPGRGYVLREPLGVVLVIAPWNYPIQLLLAPVVAAVAAGNAVVMKPSELAPATSATVARLVPQYLDLRAISVVEGAVPETTALLEQRFDHIFYTGGARVGRIVATAAARHLTPITLELGGKSPVYVDDSVDLRAAAKRIAWGKFLNAGQTCVAPDYLLATTSVADRIVPLIGDAVRELYGNDPQASGDYARIVDDARFGVLNALLDDGTAAIGGTADAEDRYIAPTVLTNVPDDAAVMQEEIFGPILPVIEVASHADAIRRIAAAEKSLALYVFSDRDEVRKAFLRGTSSGALGFNVALVHQTVDSLPFGGVGGSGMGRYHGEYGFVTFSHEKPVLSKPLKPESLALVFPPYTAKVDGFVRGLLRKLS